MSSGDGVASRLAGFEEEEPALEGPALPQIDGTLPMLYMTVHRVSPWYAHGLVLHVDYHRWPSRSWEVCQVDVPIIPGWSAREVALAVGRALVEALEEDLDEEAASDAAVPREDS